MSNLLDKLSAPFEESEIHWKPQVTSKDGSKALPVCYIDARAVMDRLDEVCGVDGWQDQYDLMHDGNIMCKLSLWSEEKKCWITKCDIGDAGAVGDAGDKAKGAYSNALKRAAVKFGIGRYLYQVKIGWVDYDAQKKKFVSTPRMPAKFLPGKSQGQAPSKPSANGASTTWGPGGLESWTNLIKLLADQAHIPVSRITEVFGVSSLKEMTLEQFQAAEKKLRLTLDQMEEQSRREAEIFDNADRIRPENE